MTGTPLQNRPADFSSLLQFLQVFPYSDHKVFESHVVDVWKGEGDEAAIDRLKKLVEYLALRRSQAAIELPERTDTVQYLDFNPMELAEYRQLELPILEMLDDALINEGCQSGMYMHALTKVNSLRKFFATLAYSHRPSTVEAGSTIPKLLQRPPPQHKKSSRTWYPLDKFRVHSTALI
jgi:SWI/SNF-related matrix-associated actin-dependent regulator of chromatin subfamily A3